MAEQRPVIVAGAGIGGLTAALALHQQGVPVEVLERRQNRTIALAGTGMTIWSNATTALGHLGLERQLRENGAVIRRAVHHSERDEVMFSTDVEGCEWPGSVPSLSVARGALVSTLLEACEDRGIPVHFGRQVTGATPAGVLVGGEFVGARAVIGADGARSVLRQGLAGGQARYYGITVWRGLSEARDSIEDGVAHMFQTQRRSGLAGMAWRIGDGRVAWTIGIKTAEGGTTADPRQTVLDLVEGVQGPPREWVRATPADGVIRVDLFELPWQEQWGAGRVTLIGDAAHAMPTVLGQGACQAIEDGIEVARQLGRANGDVEPALRAYERERIERVRWVRSQVDKLSRMQKISNPVLVRLRDVAGRALAPRFQPKMWRTLLRPPAPLPNVRTSA